MKYVDKPSFLSAIDAESATYLSTLNKHFPATLSNFHDHWGYTAPRYTCQWAYYVRSQTPITSQPIQIKMTFPPYFVHGANRKQTASGLLRKLRNDPSFLLTRLPPWISLLCILVGVASLLVLPLDEYSRRTYVSENALLPGQVHTYFAGSEQNIFRGYKRQLESVIPPAVQEGEGENEEQWKVVSDTVQGIFRAAGLKVATQNYEYHSAGNVHKGQNVYSIIHAPRGDATEAIVLVAAWRTIDGELNLNGVALALTLARYFKSMLACFPQYTGI